MDRSQAFEVNDVHVVVINIYMLVSYCEQITAFLHPPLSMPSHTAASALIKFYSFDGAPWKWRDWQARTNVKYGLFPPDDKQLPPGFSREDAINVESYFIAYNALPNEDDKIKFATKTKGGAAYPGRRIWNDFVTRNWGRWGLHTVIVNELKDANIHPQDILIREPSIPWPVADSYVPVILDSLGLKLFGEEAFPDDSDILPTDLRLCLKIIVQRSWGKIRQQLSALKSRAATIEKNARDAFQGDVCYRNPFNSQLTSMTELEAKEEKPLKSQVNKTIRAVAKWKECAEVLNTSSHVATANEMLGALQNIMETLGAKITTKRRIEPGATKGMRI
jgi:TATA-binding protein-associated factor